MKCKQCKYIKVCMAQADMLGQVFDVNYDGKHGCPDFTPFTNADHIRAMNDEELSKILSQLACTFLCSYCKKFHQLKKHGDKCDSKCDMAYLDWLKQPYVGEQVNEA